MGGVKAWDLYNIDYTKCCRDSILNRFQSSRHQEDSPPTISTPHVTSQPTTPPTSEVISHNAKSLCHQTSAHFLTFTKEKILSTLHTFKNLHCKQSKLQWNCFHMAHTGLGSLNKTVCSRFFAMIPTTYHAKYKT